MRWLLTLLVAVSASADCTSHVLYHTNDYITGAVFDDSLYVSLLQAGDIERIDATTGQTSVVANDGVNHWDVQHGFLATAETIGRPDKDIKSLKVRDGYVYWLETDGVHADRRQHARSHSHCRR
jgi:hypothetical protein